MGRSSPIPVCFLASYTFFKNSVTKWGVKERKTQEDQTWENICFQYILNMLK